MNLTPQKDNPKYIQAQKEGKAPMELIPWNVLEEVAHVFKHGADKYGERNWRVDPINASTYEASTFRHVFLQWAQGEDIDPDSGRHHLAHAIAGLMIVLDSWEQGTLVDDRDRCESKAGDVDDV